MKVSILIVDDTETDRYLLKRLLDKTSKDILLSEASDGQRAVEFFDDYCRKKAADPERHPPLLIFLDINMPRMNGFEFLEQFSSIRQDWGIMSTVVIMFSSSPRMDDKVQAFGWKFVKDFIVKGEFSHQELDVLITDALASAGKQS